jgi:hypothetical protein
MKLFKLNNTEYRAQDLSGTDSCHCTGTNCFWQCLPDPVVPVWILVSPPCGCLNCSPPNDQCDGNKFNHVLPTPCIEFDMIERTCSKGVDENGCVVFGTCGDPDCESSCTVETPCENENPCCDSFLFCDDDPNSPSCGQCVLEQGGAVSDCFNCPTCDSSFCNPTDPPPPGPPPPPPPSPPSPPSPPPGPDPDPPCEKYTTGTLEYRDGIWTCVDKISRQEIPAECCDLPPVTPTITVTETTGPTATPTTIGPTPTPNTNDPCNNIEILNTTNDVFLFEQICNCKCDARYVCFDGHCVQDPTGPHDSYLSCLTYLCGSGDCSSATIPDPTPLPPISPICQDPLIIDQ